MSDRTNTDDPRPDVTRERCHVCDAPLASEEDREERLATAPHHFRPDLCWNPVLGFACCRSPVDWRARALAAEAELDLCKAGRNDHRPAEASVHEIYEKTLFELAAAKVWRDLSVDHRLALTGCRWHTTGVDVPNEFELDLIDWGLVDDFGELTDDGDAVVGAERERRLKVAALRGEP